MNLCLAGTYAEYLYARRHGEIPKDTRYVGTMRDVVGIRNPVVFQVGTFLNHPEYHKLSEYLKTKEAVWR